MATAWAERLALVLLMSCARPSSDAASYLDGGDARPALEASLTHDNGYARLRRESYAHWMKLPELPFAGDGRAAFFTLPLQRAPAGLPYLVDGRFTCATCHVRANVVGAPNVDLDVGAAILAASPHASPEAAAIALSWGSGRVDVSSASGTEPARIPDLRPVRYQRFLQYSGAVRNHDLTSLALRIETLIITATNETARPSRRVAMALAVFVNGLADALPSATEPPAVYRSECAGCHEGDALVDADEVATDPTLAGSIERGTGKYRAPTLRGVSLRAPLMHDASVASLDVLLDASRLGGHRFGLELAAADRNALVRWLKSQ